MHTRCISDLSGQTNGQIYNVDLFTDINTQSNTEYVYREFAHRGTLHYMYICMQLTARSYKKIKITPHSLDDTRRSICAQTAMKRKVQKIDRSHFTSTRRTAKHKRFSMPGGWYILCRYVRTTVSIKNIDTILHSCTTSIMLRYLVVS